MADEEAPEQGELAITRTGDRLRLAREAAGLSLADVASRTRITQRHLEAIEKSDFSELPGRTYVTGFARAYARAVDLPEAEIGTAIRRELEEDAYGARPLYEAYEPTDPARLPTARMAWTLVIVALLLVAAYGVWRFLSVEPSEELIAAQNEAAENSEASSNRTRHRSRDEGRGSGPGDSRRCPGRADRHLGSLDRFRRRDRQDRELADARRGRNL
ncbi:helix-turn-helix domain-containing protein [Sphingopyxis sp. PET50]|uniref:helix-turn-helix domain-containing protein n=1 Tax=Sphingopyxis sp. PET50 TaxID=2976533 RepID=UPI0021AED179|nr:helix-turn-helix domain-containing protein [Sphingopyxis sp. PET50]